MTTQEKIHRLAEISVQIEALAKIAREVENDPNSGPHTKATAALTRKRASATGSACGNLRSKLVYSQGE